MFIVAAVNLAGLDPMLGHERDERIAILDDNRVDPIRRSSMSRRYYDSRCQIAPGFIVVIHVVTMLFDGSKCRLQIRVADRCSDVVHVKLVARLGDLLRAPEVFGASAIEPE